MLRVLCSYIGTKIKIIKIKNDYNNNFFKKKNIVFSPPNLYKANKNSNEI